MRRILRWVVAIAIVLAAVLFGAFVAARFQAGPLGPFPGGPFEGPMAAPATLDPVAAGAHETIAIEVGEPDPRTRTTWVVEHEGTLYVGALLAEHKEWPRQALASGRLRARIGDALYAMRVERVTDPALRAALFDAMARKYDAGGSEDMRDGTWFFRLEPVTPADVAGGQG